MQEIQESQVRQFKTTVAYFIHSVVFLQARLVRRMCTGAGDIVAVPAILVSILEWPLLTQLETHSVFLNLVEMTCVDLLP